VHIFVVCNGRVAIYGDNLVSLYQLSFVYIGRNWVNHCDQWSVTSYIRNRLLDI